MRRIGMALLASIIATTTTGGARAADYAFITTTDFSTGSSSAIALPAKTTTNNVEPIHTDATARWFDGLIYVVNRVGADNVQVLDPAQGFDTIDQFSVGNGSNPYDIVVVSPTVAYVTRYDTDELWKVNPTTGAHTGTISFASLADADGIPEMAQMCRVGDRIFVAVQRLDRNNFYSPVAPSYLAVIDTNTDTLLDVDPVAPGTQHIELAGTNPFSDVQVDGWGGRLYVACAGFFGLSDAGVAAVDPTTLESTGVILTGAEAGGDVLDVEIVSDVRGYAIIATPSFVNTLIAFDPQTGTKLSTVYAPGDYTLQDIELSPDGELFLADRTPTAPGIRCYDAATGVELTTSPIDVGLPPFDITFPVPVQTGVDDRAPSAVRLDAAYPNPFNPATTIPFSLERAGVARIEIFDALGRSVRGLAERRFPAGRSEVAWDGTDARGIAAPSGVYFARLTSGGVTVTRKLTLLK